MYQIKPNGEEAKYEEEIESFTTQHGYEAIRFIGDEIPECKEGFKAYDDQDQEVLDLSRFKYQYRQNEYSVEEDEIEVPKGNNDSSSSSSGGSVGMLMMKMQQMESQIVEIIPYVETKTAYIDDTEIEFDITKEGNILLSATDNDGDSVEILLKREGNKAIGKFLKPLEKVTNVTMSIQ